MNLRLNFYSKNAVKQSDFMYVLFPDRNRLLHGHCKGKYFPLYAYFDMHPSELIHII